MIKMKINLLYVTGILLFLSNTLFSQSLSVTLGNVNACKGDTITVPVIVKGFSNICAIGLRVSYDNTKLKFLNCINIRKEVPGADYADVQGFITLGWFSANESIVANINDNEKLFSIRFICLSHEDTKINFVESASIASDCDLKQIPIVLTNNTITSKKNCK